MNTDEDFEVTLDDAEIATLLRAVGSRDEPPDHVMRDVQASVHAEWQQVVAARRRRRSLMWAAAAAVLALVVGTTATLQLTDADGRPIATLQRSDGAIFIAADGHRWSLLNAGQRIAVGDYLRSDGRAAVRFDDGLALRIDRGTAVRLTASDRLALNIGALYVDSQPGNRRNELSIDTHAGSVRHLGTQYQVRAFAGGIDVSVREGRVVIDNPTGSNVAAAGERLQISTQGVVQRDTVSSSDEQWHWASEVAPPFVIDDQKLSAFLAWVARETGRELRYRSTTAQATAESTTLHGSIEALAPDVALTAVLATTPLRRDETQADVIEIELANAIDSKSKARPTP